MTDQLLSDRRDHVIDCLSTDYANGAFEVEELERRMALAHAAHTAAELDAIVTELVPVSSPALVEAKRMRVVMGSIERTGPWIVPHQLAARVVMGNLVLDLRDARLGASGTTIDVQVTMGNVEVIVPPGVDVEVDASSFLGNIEERTERATAGAAPVRIVGRVRLGNLEVATLRPGETKRDARRRRRMQRRFARYCARSL